MEFPGRGNTPLTQQVPPSSTPPVGHHKRPRRTPAGLMKWATFGLGGVVVLLIVAVILAVALAAPKSQSGYVYNNKLQAVFLNTGQVYFGNIKDINPQYMVLDNIYYLQSNSSSSSSSSSNSSNNVSLVKLGCELHAPYDQMVINMQQVTFWENLQSTGQVAKAVAQYQKQYPNGQTCSDQSSSSGSTTNSVQNAPANSASKKP